MKKNTQSKNLTLEERFYIESCLMKGLCFSEIASLLKRHPKTISREVKRHRHAKCKDPGLKKQKCLHHKTCTITNLCTYSYCNKSKPCARCKLRTCAHHCNNYVPGSCSKLTKPPYVCNGCPLPRTCGYDKMYYRARYANDCYHEAMSLSREGINMTPDELNSLDTFVSPLLLKGQSIAHIYAAHADELPCSKRTLYNYVDHGVLTARNLDLPRKVKYKPRRKLKVISYPSYRESRSYNDFLDFMLRNPDTQVVEMDTVEGSRGGKVILTLLFRNCNFMLMFLLESNTQACVEEVFIQLEGILGIDGFRRLFPVILTDNGSEFKNPEVLEKNTGGEKRTTLFYCDPHKSWQKAKIEKNHEFIRYVLPKGKSFEKLNQGDITLLCNHINSIARASLNERTPFELANLLIDSMVLKALDLHPISSDEVLLRPSLLK